MHVMIENSDLTSWHKDHPCAVTALLEEESVEEVKCLTQSKHSHGRSFERACPFCLVALPSNCADRVCSTSMISVVLTAAAYMSPFAVMRMLSNCLLSIFAVLVWLVTAYLRILRNTAVGFASVIEDLYTIYSKLVNNAKLMYEDVKAKIHAMWVRINAGGMRTQEFIQQTASLSLVLFCYSMTFTIIAIWATISTIAMSFVACVVAVATFPMKFLANPISYIPFASLGAKMATSVAMWVWDDSLPKWITLLILQVVAIILNQIARKVSFSQANQLNALLASAGVRMCVRL